MGGGLAMLNFGILLPKRVLYVQKFHKMSFKQEESLDDPSKGEIVWKEVLVLTYERVFLTRYTNIDIKTGHCFSHCPLKVVIPSHGPGFESYTNSYEYPFGTMICNCYTRCCK